MAITCLFCNHQNSADARFCNKCGAATEGRPCKQCNAVDKRTSTHCHQCGAPFASSAEAAAHRDTAKADRLASTLMGYGAGVTEPPLFRPWSTAPLRERGPVGFDEKSTSFPVPSVSDPGMDATYAGAAHPAHGGDLPARRTVASLDASSSDSKLASGVQPTHQRGPDHAPGAGGPAPAPAPDATPVAGRERQPSARHLRSIVLAVALLVVGAAILTALLERDERPVGAEPEVRATPAEASRSDGPAPSTNARAGEIALPRDAAGPSPPPVPAARVLPAPGAEDTSDAPPTALGAATRTLDPEAGASVTAAASPGGPARPPATVATRPPPRTGAPATAPVPAPRKTYIPPDCSPALAAIGLCSPSAPAPEK